MAKAKPTKKQTSPTTPDKEQPIREKERLQEKQSERNRTISRVPGFSDYIDKLKYSSDYKYLMLAGRSPEVKVCIECIERLGFNETARVTCIGKSDKTLKKEIYDKFSTDKNMSEEEMRDAFKRDVKLARGVKLTRGAKLTRDVRITPTEQEEIFNEVRMREKEEIKRTEIRPGASVIHQRLQDKKRLANNEKRERNGERRVERDFRENKLCILNNISEINNNVWLELTTQFRNTTGKPDFLIATVQSKEELNKLPDPWCGLFKIISLDKKDKQQVSKVETKKKRKHRISDKKFKQLCKEVEKGHCTRAAGEMPFFKKLSEMSKSSKYDKTGRGYTTWQSAKSRYYEVFSSKKTNN